jgi:uncharacterized membrane protein YraQ (UPF0718 family)
VLGLSWLVARSDVHRDNRSNVANTTETPPTLRTASRHFASTAGRLGLLVVPEYLAAVLLIGLVAGIVPAAVHGAGAPLGLALVAVSATLFVIPTGGEIPLALGALAAGFGNGVAAVLLVALPALSLPSMIMMRRALPARTLAGLAAAVAVAAFTAGVVVGLL